MEHIIKIKPVDKKSQKLNNEKMFNICLNKYTYFNKPILDQFKNEKKLKK